MTSCIVVPPLWPITNISMADQCNQGVDSTLATQWPRNDGMSGNVFQSHTADVTGCQNLKKVTSIETKEIMEWTYGT